MSAKTEIDEDKLTILFERASKKAESLKDQYSHVVGICNQIRGIQKDKDGKAPKSMLTEKELNPALRKMIYDDIITAATRMKLL